MRTNQGTVNLTMDGLVVLLGVTTLNQFFEIWIGEGIWPRGFTNSLQNIAYDWPNDSLMHVLLLPLIPYENLIRILLSLLCLGAGITLILGIAKSYASVFTGIGYFLIWLILGASPGIWTFEYLFPAWFGLCLALAYLREPQGLTRPVLLKLGFSTPLAYLILIALSASLYWLSWVASPAPHFYIAFGVSTSFFLLSLFHFYLDKNLKLKTDYELTSPLQQTAIHLMILSIGAMLIMQIYANWLTVYLRLKALSL